MIMYNVCFDRPINTINPARYVQHKIQRHVNAKKMKRKRKCRQKWSPAHHAKVKTDMDAKMQVYMLMKLQSTLVDQDASMRTRGWLLAERVGRSLMRQPRRRKRFTLSLGRYISMRILDGGSHSVVTHFMCSQILESSLNVCLKKRVSTRIHPHMQKCRRTPGNAYSSRPSAHTPPPKARYKSTGS